MAAGEDKSADFYAVLGLRKECSEPELRIAYKKLAMRWHPDKCLSSGNAHRMEEAKEKFQEIQKAYSVLSDSNKRFLYDVGVYDNEDDNDENGMGDFVREIAQMMRQNKPSDNGQDSFDELQQMFLDMFQDDLDAGFGDPWTWPTNGLNSSTSSGVQFANGGNNGSNKRGNTAMNTAKANLDGLEHCATGFCFGSKDAGQSSKGKVGINSNRRNGRKQKLSSRHDVSSCDAETRFLDEDREFSGSIMVVSRLSHLGVSLLKESRLAYSANAVGKLRIADKLIDQFSITRENLIRGPSSHYLYRLSKFCFSSAASGNSAEGDSEKNDRISVTFVDKDGEEKVIKVPIGMSMLEAAHENDIELEGACEGSLACSTCHVIVMDVDYYNKLEDPADEENDMLDLAFGLTETSRLGCQIIAKPELDGIRLALPAATRNFAVDGYIPKPH
ncbi:hypothetical protein Cni_G04532 [Canna indica]|uniref:2Fe-2S ferredoxin-type domain-containing protein n=1 Tax=Canna indica TaxID=4628 RepID=A0AAQ3JX72_9LILI|nr:hypothetical protein Cni_G04532 [Canna indica]